MINELILKNSPNSWLRNGFKKQCFMILFAVLYTGSQTSFKGLFISLFSILKDSETRSHTDNFGENNVKCLIAKGICRFVPHSSAGGF